MIEAELARILIDPENPPRPGDTVSFVELVAGEPVLACLGLTTRNVVYISFADSPYTAKPGDVVCADATNGPVDVEISPDIGTYSVKKWDGSVNVVTVVMSGGGTLDGAAGLDQCLCAMMVLAQLNQGVSVVTDGVNGVII